VLRGKLVMLIGGAGMLLGRIDRLRPTHATFAARATGLRLTGLWIMLRRVFGSLSFLLVGGGLMLRRAHFVRLRSCGAAPDGG